MPARILVVDDQEAVREFTRKILVRAGYEVALAGNGAEALAALDEADFDLILMDAHMPVMTGAAATRRIRALEGPRSTIPIIAFSGDEQSLGAAGVNDHIDKPFTRAELLAKVDAWMPCDAERAAGWRRGKAGRTGFPGNVRTDGPALGPARPDKAHGANRRGLWRGAGSAQMTNSWSAGHTRWSRWRRFSDSRRCRKAAARWKKRAEAGKACSRRSSAPGLQRWRFARPPSN